MKWYIGEISTTLEIALFGAGIVISTLELALIGAGLVILYYALTNGSKLMKASGYIMLIGGISGLLLTILFWWMHLSSGYFPHTEKMSSQIIEQHIEK